MFDRDHIVTTEREQRATCSRFSALFVPASDSDRVGIALSTLNDRPLNGLRHAPANGTCGWYIWGGEEISDDPDFFQPLHVQHLAQRCPEVLRFLGLPPGFRFLIAPGHEDVWEDEGLLGV